MKAILTEPEKLKGEKIENIFIDTDNFYDDKRIIIVTENSVFGIDIELDLDWEDCYYPDDTPGIDCEIRTIKSFGPSEVVEYKLGSKEDVIKLKEKLKKDELDRKMKDAAKRKREQFKEKQKKEREEKKLLEKLKTKYES